MLAKTKIFIIGLFIISAPVINQAKAQSLTNNRIFYLSDTSINFDGLIRKFNGKIVYVDIWATWCSPCKRELRNAWLIKAFEHFASKNNIVVLYICCDRTGGQWKQFINANKLSGYHILVNKNLDNDFHTTFSSVQKRNGTMKRSFYIPRHIIVDKNGIVADSAAANQGNPLLYTQIKRLLNKTGKY